MTESAFSSLDGLAVLFASLPVTVVAMRSPWNFSWYCVFPILAAEILALIAAGIISSVILLIDRNGTDVCSKCGGEMFLAGRHFNPAGDETPHYSDFIVLAVFIVINVLFWVMYLNGILRM